ncbi:hypothetical protein [Candidatus Puniceispirillum marinum]|uniref:hypothetical protein n=1 Tax=Candidatus Puniceispirillum marinum TaxID=767892 RepID=UPI0005A41B0F|nr:hypothetical protein [Candidatus Puniceispirillum marinum]
MNDKTDSADFKAKFIQLSWPILLVGGGDPHQTTFEAIFKKRNVCYLSVITGEFLQKTFK